MEILKFRHHYADLFANLKPIFKRAEDEINGNQSRNSFLRTYAFANIHEYFAVATEAYFEKGTEMKNQYPQLYSEMQRFYNTKNEPNH
jgi:Mlc titration factor MtfA (ptsG expression regulator)